MVGKELEMKGRKILSRDRYCNSLWPHPIVRYRDELRWDPNELDFVSCATGKPNVFEDLYRTADGRWIIHREIRPPERPHYWFESFNPS